MATPTTPSRLEAVLAYLLSALTMLLWVGCVVPSGDIVPPLGADPLPGDAATPLHREAQLLVPALLLLILMPVGSTISRRFVGQMATLATTDAFVTLYAAVVFALHLSFASVAADHIVVALLFLLGALSVLEIYRCLRAGRLTPAPHRLRGARLALCVLVLVIPSRFLIHGGDERASWLAPFLFVAVSAAGARLAYSVRGMRLTGAVLQLLLAVHVIITLRLTLGETEPIITHWNLPGHLTMAVAIAVGGVALLQVLVLAIPGGAQSEPEPARKAPARPTEQPDPA